MYFMPASWASRTQASASNFTGFHCFGEGLVLADRDLRPVHDPLADAGTGLPFHSPAGMA